MVQFLGSTSAPNVSKTASRRSSGLKTPQRSSTPNAIEKPLWHLLDQAIKLKNRGDFAGSVKILKSAVKEFPEDGPTWWLLGATYYYGLDQPRRAIPCFRRAIAIGPQSEGASLGLFHSLWSCDLVKQAIAEMKRFQSVAHSTDYDEIFAELCEKGLLH